MNRIYAGTSQKRRGDFCVGFTKFLIVETTFNEVTFCRSFLLDLTLTFLRVKGGFSLKLCQNARNYSFGLDILADCIDSLYIRVTKINLLYFSASYRPYW